ncbi:retrovirus-related Pol polyprotein from transposon 17.6 [Nephila pilipes]|uniref:Retrovirus-related Pol polyprotein from transposon 17.6 n=1 Tax=Nephila pilipes TaxID=299642 RepID=A0A8X6URK9_NEPPI|nr:retrovirus-related Pol polyprotein from transposon 17.6 [Nephila pilipes]
MRIVNGQQSTPIVQKATVTITVCGRTFQTDLSFLTHAKGNRNLIGIDFLKTPGIVMNMHKNYWYFVDKPNCIVHFTKDNPLPTNGIPVEMNSSSCPTNSTSSDFLYRENLLMKLKSVIFICVKKRYRILMQKKDIT